MKSIVIAVCMLLGLATQASAGTDSIVYVRRGALPPDIAKRFEQSTPNVKSVDDIMQSVEQFKDKVDPREIGLAIDTVSNILSRQSNKFADSRVGKFTITVILWRIFGHGVRVLINKIIFFVISLIIFCVTWRRCIEKRTFVKQAKINPKIFQKNTVLETYVFEDTNDLLEENKDNNNDIDADLGASAVFKIILLVFFVFASLITLFG
ncbi:MAG TPA: hypothetical protein VL576_00215 [Candidatus Paceibacterota bacterium]|jgi:hypothetical protein|nr:hypothetical protein [Candidatus Paceibacterota bacterium]